MASTQKTAFICGVSGQDGSYLAAYLLARGYRVFGSSRDAQVSRFQNLKRLGITSEVEVLSMAPTDFRSVFSVLQRVRPDEVYNLAGQTSVGLSFEQPVEAMESISTGTLNLLEAIRLVVPHVRFYNASSTECFGTTAEAATEQTPFRPRSPYGVAKAAAFWAVANYREAYGLFACSGILSNHESPLRPKRFVTQKIVEGACAIAAGQQKELCLGTLDIVRDWGWAPDYVRAMHLMLQCDEPDDYLIATGESHSLQEFVVKAFELVGLDWQSHVLVDPSLVRPADIRMGLFCPDRAEQELGWQAEFRFDDVISKMVAACQESGNA